MKYFLNNFAKQIAMIVILLAIAFAITTNIREADQEAYDAKLEMKQQEIIDLKEISNKKSDIEMLEFHAKENAYYAKEKLDSIAGYKAEIINLEEGYETNILFQRCFESQIDRKINGLEYNMEYCKDKDNLDQFRSKKY